MKDEAKMDANRLIAEVYKRPALWNQRHISYHNRDVTNRVWMEISAILKYPKQVLKTKWKGLRDTFRAEIKKEQVYRKTKFPRNRPVWMHFKTLQFLKEQMLPRPPIWERSSCSTDKNNERLPNGGVGPSDSAVNAHSRPVALRHLNRHAIASVGNNKHQIIRKESENETNESNNILERNHVVIPVKQEPPDTKYETANVDDDFENGSADLMNENEMLILQHVSPEQVLMNEATSENSGAIDPLGVTSGNNRFDDNYYFFMSLLPHIRTLPAERRMLLRMQMQQLVYQEVYKRTSEQRTDDSSTTANNETPFSSPQDES